MLPQIQRAGNWFVQSGIQAPDGGVARFYRTDEGRNQAVSTEITGYAVSTLVYLHSVSADKRYLDRAAAGAQFLCNAWDPVARAMPFEAAPADSYFFDCGIIVRGLLAAWRATGTQQFLDTAIEIGRQMARDFASSDGDYHPVLRMPGKSPAPRDPLRWSQAAGCYQLKAALAWWDLAEATGEDEFREPYRKVLAYALMTHCQFLPGHPEQAKVMDRLHAYSYFLEGLIPCLGEPRCAAAMADGLRRVARHLREIAPEFERSDVYAQLLRARLYADAAGVVPLDREAARCEASRLADFQVSDSDSRIDGGFYFGRRDSAWLPYVNPVSTGFALQALAMWDAAAHSGNCPPLRHLLV